MRCSGSLRCEGSECSWRRGGSGRPTAHGSGGSWRAASSSCGAACWLLRSSTGAASASSGWCSGCRRRWRRGGWRRGAAAACLWCGARRRSGPQRSRRHCSAARPGAAWAAAQPSSSGAPHQPSCKCSQPRPRPSSPSKALWLTLPSSCGRWRRACGAGSLLRMRQLTRWMAVLLAAGNGRSSSSSHRPWAHSSPCLPPCPSSRRPSSCSTRTPHSLPQRRQSGQQQAQVLRYNSSSSSRAWQLQPCPWLVKRRQQWQQLRRRHRIQAAHRLADTTPPATPRRPGLLRPRRSGGGQRRLEGAAGKPLQRCRRRLWRRSCSSAPSVCAAWSGSWRGWSRCARLAGPVCCARALRQAQCAVVRGSSAPLQPCLMPQSAP